MSFQPMPLTLIQRHRETADTVSFYFQNQRAAPIDFKPGQFMMLEVVIDGEKYVRAYSIGSQPKADKIKITIKRVLGGVVSNWLIDNLQQLDQIMMLNIAGEFNIIDQKPREKLLFISAGCGITPVMSMGEYLLNNSPNTQIHFLHCAQDEQNIIYADQLQKLATLYPHFNYHLRLKHAVSDHSVSQSSIGRITAEFLKTNYPDIHNSSIYLCGSSRFMLEIKQILKDLSFDCSHFYHESFTSQTETEITQNSDSVANIHVPAFNFNQSVSINDNLLHILEAAQLPIIGACRMGVCGSCKCKIESGEVESENTSILTEQEIKQGYRLACISRIKSDIQVSLT